MRIIAIILLSFSLLLLLRRVDFMLQIIPLAAPGPEGGMIEIGIDTVFGGGATILGLIFAIIHYFRARPSKIAAWLLVLGCLQLLGFIGFLVYDIAA